jgi:predicted RNA polymerase sigma factor
LKTPDLVEHFFRHEYGRLVALLVARAGIGRIEDIEDAVQGALLTALERWPYHGAPDNPSAWLTRSPATACSIAFARKAIATTCSMLTPTP